MNDARMWIDDEGLHVEGLKRASTEHGFAQAEIVDGLHAPKCIDHMCDGCVPLDSCHICDRPEYEHGDGIE